MPERRGIAGLGEHQTEAAALERIERPCTALAKCGLSRLATNTVTIEERPERRLEAMELTT